ncbi:MAG: SDH family Clp fold serine proteinase [Promethearchaeota archaeon]
MTTWNEILKELSDLQKDLGKQSSFDITRRKYLFKLHEYTNRNTILYASKWTQPGTIPSDLINITDEDVQGFMTVIAGLTGDELDIILHSPGGSAEATEALVKYLRAKFNHIRIIIPYAAMSAGTMLACSADEIIMGNHSFLGPTDPQIISYYKEHITSDSAYAIKEQFKIAKKEIEENPRSIGV